MDTFGLLNDFKKYTNQPNQTSKDSWTEIIN